MTGLRSYDETHIVDSFIHAPTHGILFAIETIQTAFSIPAGVPTITKQFRYPLFVLVELLFLIFG